MRTLKLTVVESLAQGQPTGKGTGQAQAHMASFGVYPLSHQPLTVGKGDLLH